MRVFEHRPRRITTGKYNRCTSVINLTMAFLKIISKINIARVFLSQHLITCTVETYSYITEYAKQNTAVR